ncbi:MAG: 4-hydroxy-3-methylbut-2-enyl diphosphate reductase [Caldisericia bacterium]|nr:4-hydroxy-3-methylbut-2-enyl diphosphate reductase [Caldisericia bacterium]
MKVVLPEACQGFCFGVKRAIDEVTSFSKTGEVQVLGHLVHNPQVVANLEHNGVHTIESPDQSTSGIVAITAHGAPKDVYNGFPNIRIIDCTCPFVKRLQKRVAELSDEGYKVIIVGDSHHPEVVSVSSFAVDPIVVGNIGQAMEIGFFKKIAVLSQTTQDTSLLRDVACELTGHTDLLLFENTICTSTRERQAQLLEVAGKCKAVVVVGGKVSANTKRLYQLSKQKGAQTFWIEGPEELGEEVLIQIKTASGDGCVGLVSGASTPTSTVLQVFSILSSY